MLKSLFLIIVSFFFFVSCGEDNPVVDNSEANFTFIKMPNGIITLVKSTTTEDNINKIITKIKNKSCQSKLYNNSLQEIKTNSMYLQINDTNYLQTNYEENYKNNKITFMLQFYIDKKLDNGINEEYINQKIKYKYENNIYLLDENNNYEIFNLFYNKVNSIKLY